MVWTRFVCLCPLADLEGYFFFICTYLIKVTLNKTQCEMFSYGPS